MATIDLNEARRITAEKEKQYGLPEGTLMRIGGIESSFNGNAVSPKGALGYFQFMPATAKKYGLTDPSNFEQSADAAGRYMADNLKRFNGNMDMALADYNGGPRAVAALAKGKPWKETSDYLSKFYGGSYTPTSSQFTSARSESSVPSPSVSQLYRMEQERDAKYGGVLNNIANLPSAVSAGFQLDNSVYNFWKTKGLEQVDPNWSLTKEAGEQALKDIPKNHWEYVLQAKSQAELEGRRGRVLDAMKKEEELSKMGVAGIAGRVAAGLIDIPTLIAFVPGLGGEGLLTATSRVSNAVRMGMVGAGSNVAFDAASMSYRPLAESNDLYVSALAGLSLGALGGAAVNPARVAERRLAQETKDLGEWARRQHIREQYKELQDSGLPLTDYGRKQFQEWLDIETKKAGEEVRREIERKASLLRKELKFDAANDNEIGRQLKEEIKVKPPEAPVWERGRMPEPEFGAEAKVRRFMQARDMIESKLSASDWVDAHFTFTKDGKIKSQTGTFLTRDDLAIVGIKTRAELENLVNKARFEAHYDRLVRFANKDSTHSVLERLSQSSDATIAPLAKRLREQLLGDVPLYRIRQKDIDMTFPSSRKGQYGGFYSSQRHAIFVPENTTDQVLLHEILHAANVHKIDYGLANPNTVHGQLVKELDGLYKQALDVAKQQGYRSYYLTNIKEFTAGLYTGNMARDFHEFLAAIKTSNNERMLSKIIDVIRRMFGFGEEETNALIKALDLADRLNDERLTVTMDKGKLGMDTIHFAPTSGAIDPDAAMAASKADLPPIFGWGLGLEHRLGSAKVPEAVRSLASKLFGTTVGYKDHAVVKANAWDDTTKWAEGWTTELRKAWVPAYMEYLEKNGVKKFERAQAFEKFGTEVSNYVRGIDGDYSPEVIKAGDGIRKQLSKAVDYINNPMLDEGGNKRGLTMDIIRDPETGEEKLVGQLEKNQFYLPRKHDINKWNSVVSAYGREAVEGWWARAFQSAREGIDDAAAQKFGKWYVRAVEDAHANRTQDLLEEMMKGSDKEALKMSLMTNGGFSEQEAMKIVMDMFPSSATDSGRMMSSLKHRNTINEKYTETWTLPGGEKVEVGLNNFIHTNAFEVVEPYLRRTASSVALAKHLDVYKVGDIDRLIAEATDNRLGTAFKTKGELQKLREDLKFAFDRVQGIPQEEFNWWRKGAEMWRNFNVIRLMGGAVWNQATELSQITGTMGFKATMEAIPELRALRRDIVSGAAPNEILDHLENTIGGVGSEYIRRMEFSAKDDWVRNLGDTKFNQWLDKTDSALKKLSSGVLDYTGMTPLMVQQKRVHAVALVNHFVNTATGKIESKFLTKERLAWMGLDEADTARLMGNLKKYTKEVQGEHAKTHKLDLDRWLKEDPESHSKFMTAIHRESRRVVQENDLASMIPIMGGTLGQTLFQFMNFSMHGWNKSLMFAANHRDWSTLSTVLHGSLLASLSYMGRTLLESQGMDDAKRREFLDKRMAPTQVVANSFGRLAQMSLIPNVYDTLSPWPMFSGMRTTSDLSSLASNPTYQAINGLISMKKLLRNGLSDEYQTTSKDVKTWGKLLPLNNVFPISTMLNSIANDYPSSEKE